VRPGRRQRFEGVARRVVARTESQRVIHGIVTAIDADQTPSATVAVGPASHPAWSNDTVEYAVGDKVSLSFNGRSYTIVGRLDPTHQGAPVVAAHTHTPAPALVHIETATGGTDNLVVSSIPGTYRHLRVLGQLNHDQGASFVTVRIRLNGITTANYYGIRSSIVAAGGVGLIDQHISAQVAWEFDVGNAGSSFEMLIPNYAASGLIKGVRIDTYARIGSGASSNKLITVGGYIDTLTAAVTDVRAFLPVGLWLSGSSLSVYGVT
jgi:hypothetical protein